MTSIVNGKIQFREPLPPFAPLVLEEGVDDYFEMSCGVPFAHMSEPLERVNESIYVTH